MTAVRGYSGLFLLIIVCFGVFMVVNRV